MSSRRRTSLPPDREAGFTLAEVLAALALLSSLALVVAAGFVTGDRSLERVRSSARRSAQVLRMDAAVRGWTQRVLTPYWLPSPRCSRSTGALAVFYLDGSEEAALRLSLRDGILTVGDGIENVRFDGVQDAQMEIVPARQRGAPVLRLTVRLAGLQPFTILAALGGRPFPLVGTP